MMNVLFAAMGCTPNEITDLVGTFRIASIFHMALFVAETLGGAYWIGVLDGEVRRFDSFMLERMMLCFIVFVEEPRDGHTIVEQTHALEC